MELLPSPLCRALMIDLRNCLIHLHQQERSHIGWELCECKERGKDFSGQSCLKTHRRTQDGRNTYEDNQCGGRAISLTPDIVSCKTSMEQKGFKCSDSGKACVNQSYFQAQLASHNEKKLYEGKECGTAFIHSGSLCVHVKTHC